MKNFYVILVAILLGAAASPPEGDMHSGRSVAVDKPQQRYWLSDDLNRLFLKKAPRGEPAGAGDGSAH